MDRERLVGVLGEDTRGSGYVVGPRLVLTSAHVVGEAGTPVTVLRPGRRRHDHAVVVWRGTPHGRDDAALVRVEAAEWREPAGTAEPWGRMATTRTGQLCETWGIPGVIRRAGTAERPHPPSEAMQLTGTINPGSGYVEKRHLLALTEHSMREWPADGPVWAGLSGAAVVCGGLLVGVVKAEVPGFGHGLLEVVPAYLLHTDDGFLKALKDNAASSLTLGQVEFDELHARDTPAPSEGLLPPGSLLQAGRQVVAFSGREEILTRLRRWCEPAGFGVRLLHGPGGQGKTRLAARLGEVLQAADRRWTVLWPDPGAGPAELTRLRDTAEPLLVVLDYAETRQDELAALLRAGTLHRGGVPLKVLLLARTAGEWWDNAGYAPGGAVLGGAPTDELPVLAPDHETRALLYRQAAASFAERLAGPAHAPGGNGWAALAKDLPDPGPRALPSGNVLTLHMTALADLLDAALRSAPGRADGPTPAEATDPDTDPYDRKDAEDRILDHERAYWTKVAGQHPLPHGLVRRRSLADALATVVLLGGVPLQEHEREDLLRRTPVLSGLHDHELLVVREWIEAVYPSAERDPWEIVQPDRLAERFIGRHLLENRRLVHTLLAPADTRRPPAGPVGAAQSARLLTLLSRAAAHPPLAGTLDDLIVDVCTRHADLLGTVTIDVATQVERPQPLVDALTRRTEDQEVSIPALAELADHLPRTSHALAAWALHLVERLVALRRAAGTGTVEDSVALGAELRHLAKRLLWTGRTAEALTAADEAVDLLQPLLATHPQSARVHLAAALNNRSVCLGVLGRRTEALPPALEAVAHYRIVVGTEPVPEDARGNLVTSLGGLAATQSRLGRNPEALEAIQEAVGIQRGLVRAGAPEAEAGLVAQLNNLAIRHTDTGHHREAFEAASEAAERCEPLADRHPDAHLPELAMVLGTLSTCHGDLGNPEKALALVRRSVDIRERLFRERPESFRHLLAMALNSLAIDLGELGHVAESVRTAERSVGLYRELVAQEPDGHRPELAMALNTLANQYSSADDGEPALAAAEEAARIYAELDEATPGVFAADLAMGMFTRANCEAAAGRPDEAIASLFAVVAACRELAASEPRANAGSLARALHNLRICLVAADRTSEAMDLVDEALATYADPDRAGADDLHPVIVELLNSRATCLDTLGRTDEGLAPLRLAVEIARRRADGPGGAGTAALVGQLGLLAAFAFRVRRRAEAAGTVAEAIALLRSRARTEPERYEADLAGTLSHQVNLLGSIARYDEAEAAAREAVAVRCRVADRDGAAARIHVAAGLTGLAELLMMRLSPRQALEALDLARDHERRMTPEEAAAHESVLAFGQRFRGLLLFMVGRRTEALSTVREAVAAADRFAETAPGRMPGLPVVLFAAGSVLTDLELREEALPHLERAVALCRAPVEAGEAGYEIILATCLGTLAACLALEPAQPERALAATTEALEICRRLAADDPEAGVGLLARATTQQGLRLAEAGRSEESLRLTAEAVRLGRAHLAVDRDAHVLEPVDALHAFAVARRLAGVEHTEALAAIDEAVALLEGLGEREPHLAGQLTGKAAALRALLLGAVAEEAAARSPER
ncbi:trypsin-like peptidase domain-containing protein [Kitasatospora sp. NBC_01539]|uniref:trypsin-like peptidase domain-containing protein n=1 Tax=Kitasatospora sp. NBC_01539 TaxID=2903577 RepID=UPI0038601135